MAAIQVVNTTTKELGYANSENIPAGWTADPAKLQAAIDYIAQKNDYNLKVQDKLYKIAKKELEKDGIFEPTPPS